jgi:hypothetical protein
MFDEEKPYPRITEQALAGFAENQLAGARFQRRFIPPAIACGVALLGFLGSLGVPMFLMDEDDGSFPKIFLVAAAGFLAASVGLFILTWKKMVSEVPISPATGQPMKVYQLENRLNDSDYVLIYVCHATRTFFRVNFKSSADRRRIRWH